MVVFRGSRHSSTEYCGEPAQRICRSSCPPLVNAKTAQALGVNLPQALLLRANRIIG